MENCNLGKKTAKERVVRAESKKEEENKIILVRREDNEYFTFNRM